MDMDDMLIACEALEFYVRVECVLLHREVV
jgi:hypothetical protein